MPKGSSPLGVREVSNQGPKVKLSTMLRVTLSSEVLTNTVPCAEAKMTRFGPFKEINIFAQTRSFSSPQDFCHDAMLAHVSGMWLFWTLNSSLRVNLHLFVCFSNLMPSLPRH